MKLLKRLLQRLERLISRYDHRPFYIPKKWKRSQTTSPPKDTGGAK